MSIRVLHTEWSEGWGGQEMRIIGEMLVLRECGVEVYLACKNRAVIKQKAQENNIKVFTLAFRGNADVKTLFTLKKIIKKYNINIVNTHSGKDTWVGGLAAKFSGTKFIRTRHLSSPIKASRLNFINELADYIFTTGESVRKDMIKNNRINPAKIQSIPTAVDENIFDPQKYNKQDCRLRFNMEDDEISIGIIAVLRQFKRHDIFLQMAKSLISQHPDKKLKFIIAGDGPQRENISHLINQLTINDEVVLLGHIDNIAELLATLDIVVLSSDSGEGVPQSVMQALLMQTAVVATNAGSTKDLYYDNNFMLVDKNNQSQLNQACHKLINNSDLRKDFAKKSRNYILDNFSQNKMTNKILTIYKKILS